MPANFFVTGGSGFLGTHLLKELRSSSHKVTALVRNPGSVEPLLWPGLTLKKGDITVEKDVIEAAYGCEAVVHLAAATDISNFYINYKVNVVGVKNIITACKANKIRRVIFFSSHCAVRKNRDAYGITKKNGEELFEQSGLAYTIFRPTMICGRGSKEFTTFVDFICKLPIVPMIGNGKNLFQPSFVDDVIQLIINSLKNQETIGKYYEIGGKDRICADDFVKIIASKLNLKRKILHIPLRLCILGARAFGAVSRHTPVSVDQVLAFSQDNIVDLHGIQKDLGYEAQPLKLFLDKILEGPAERTPTSMSLT